MKITGIMGSERKGGNTDVMLDAALEEAQKKGILIDKIQLRLKKFLALFSSIHSKSFGERPDALNHFSSLSQA